MLSTPESWAVVWVIATVVFLLGEMAHRVRFFFLPFAVGAGVAAITGLFGLAIPLQWLVFLGTAGGGTAVLLPLGRHFERGGVSHAVGSGRWLHKEAVVLEEIPDTPGGTGLVQLERERWRAESGARVVIPVGSTVLVTAIDGTRLVVLPLEVPPIGPGSPPPAHKEQGAQ